MDKENFRRQQPSTRNYRHSFEDKPIGSIFVYTMIHNEKFIFRNTYTCTYIHICIYVQIYMHAIIISEKRP